MIKKESLTKFSVSHEVVRLYESGQLSDTVGGGSEEKRDRRHIEMTIEGQGNTEVMWNISWNKSIKISFKA